jgi:sugar phosphate permease
VSRRGRVFGLTWLSYASYYFCRKNVSITKSALQKQLGFSVHALGAVDTTYLAAYAVGQFTLGYVGDRLGARRLIGLGMLLSAALTAGAGLAASLVPMVVLFGINGFAQASGWPGNVKAMTPWFTREERGSVMGVWSTCYQVGGVAAGAACGWLLDHLGWRSVFFIPAGWVAAVGGAILLALPERDATAPEVRGSQARLEILRDPALWSLGFAYFCLKLIRYSLLFWLPYYLEKSLGYGGGRAAYQSLAFEVGGTVGAVGVGLISDRLLGGRRAIAGVAGCVALAGATWLYQGVGREGPVLNFAALALIGVALFGPDALISGAAAQDIGGTSASGTVAGFINGLGSVGAILQGELTAQVSERWGWDALFKVFMVLSLLAAAALIPRALSERQAQPRPA